MMPNRLMHYLASCSLLGLLLLNACSFNPSGTELTEAADAAAVDAATAADGAAPDDAGAVGDAAIAPDGMVQIPTTCAGLPMGSPDGIYTIDPDGTGGDDPFPVACDMTSDGGGWTIVGRERANVEGTFRYLSDAVGTPAGIADGTESGLFGYRLNGYYTEFRVQWDNGNRYIQITPGESIFLNNVDTAIPTTQFTTSEGQLQTWVSDAGGANFCRASRMSNVRPGDTSWAIKDKNDGNTACGCNSGSWAGRGAFYGGAPSNSTSCGSYGGGWAGVKDDGEQKAGLRQNTDTLLMVR